MKSPMVLLVEDNAELGVLSSAIIEAAGFSVRLARCAREANGRLDADLKPDLIVTDINLGPGPDGFALAKQARARRPDLPIVYMSALGAGRFAEEGVSRAQFVAKPFQAEAVVTALMLAMTQASAEV